MCTLFGVTASLCNGPPMVARVVRCSALVYRPLLRSAPAAVATQTLRLKHKDPKYRWHRGKKYMKVKLPDFNENDKDMTPDEIRRKMKDLGMLPPRQWQDRPMTVGSTGEVIQPYVPPEGDGKMSIVSTGGAKQRVQILEKKGKSWMSLRKIRSFDEDFDVSDFAERAQGIYERAHKALASSDDDELHATVTELAYPKMVANIKWKTLRWQLLRSLEAPRVVHVRHSDMFTKQNVFGQVTVRLHTQQLLAIYDRFGRLMYGSEVVAKDVLEYVVFEKHMANVYGAWRIHDKLVPCWMPPREPIAKTWKLDPPPTPSSADDTSSSTGEEQKQREVAAAAV